MGVNFRHLLYFSKLVCEQCNCVLRANSPSSHAIAVIPAGVVVLIQCWSYLSSAYTGNFSWSVFGIRVWNGNVLGVLCRWSGRSRFPFPVFFGSSTLSLAVPGQLRQLKHL